MIIVYVLAIILTAFAAEPEPSSNLEQIESRFKEVVRKWSEQQDKLNRIWSECEDARQEVLPLIRQASAIDIVRERNAELFEQLATAIEQGSRRNRPNHYYAVSESGEIQKIGSTRRGFQHAASTEVMRLRLVESELRRTMERERKRTILTMLRLSDRRYQTLEEMERLLLEVGLYHGYLTHLYLHHKTPAERRIPEFASFEVIYWGAGSWRGDPARDLGEFEGCFPELFSK